MKKNLFITFVLVLALTLLTTSTVSAITFGEPDGNRHPYVGAVVYPEPNGQKHLTCTGTLISPTVFLTAAHCVNWWPSAGIPADGVWVTFDEEFSQDGTFLPATYYTNPDPYHDHAHSNDIAVLVLKEPVTNITPAVLPPAGLLDQMKADGSLKDQTFVAVGYGRVRDDKTGGWHSISGYGERRFVNQSYLSLPGDWLTLSMNPSTGDGGTCYGDSGGPHFLGDTNMIASLTSQGDVWCRATDYTFRLDIEPARDYLAQFITLP